MDLQSARIFWIRVTQSIYFSAELKLITQGHELPKSSPLIRLTAYIDRDGVLRTGGRLRFANLIEETKHLVILPRMAKLSTLLIHDAHLHTLHGGTQLTLGHLRRKYWILGGRAPVRSFILKCVLCTRFRGLRAQQLMGQLPACRVNPARAFLSSGVDYAGPVLLKAWKGRGHKSFKASLVIFVCMVTSAVHLEAVSDYTADGFLAAFRRFNSRRGRCTGLFSD